LDFGNIYACLGAGVVVEDMEIFGKELCQICHPR
jgi:hypothetical protein